MIAIGATSGAVVGAWLTEQLIASGLLRTENLMLVALVPLAASILLTRSADSREADREVAAKAAAPKPETGGALPLVLRTRFLLVVAVITLLLNWVNTNGDNLLFRVVQEMLARDLVGMGITGEAEVVSYLRDATTVFYGSFFFWVNLLALVMQALLASRLLKYGGFGAIFLLLARDRSDLVLGHGARSDPDRGQVMKVAENATDYSINNTARHVLWLPMSREVTFKAKPTIDSLFVRAGDGLAALTVLIGGAGVHVPARSLHGREHCAGRRVAGGGLWVVRRYATLSESGAA